MKQILFISLLAFCLLNVTGCSEDEAPITKTGLTILKSDVDFKAVGGTGVVQFASSGGKVEAEINAEWCTITKQTESEVTFSVQPYTGYLSRSVLLTLTDGETIKRVAILQEGAIWKYDKTVNQFLMSNAGGDVPVEMSSSFPIKVSIPEEASQWLSYEFTDKGFKFIVNQNETGSARGIEVNVVTGTRETEYTILQYNPENLLGEWTGAAQVYGSQFGLDAVIPLETNTKIVSNAGKYQFQFPMIDLLNTTLFLTATYRNGMFIITTPQTQNYTLRPQGATWYGSIITMDDKGLYLKGEVAIGPFLVDGKIVMGYMTNAYMSLALFTSKTPSASTYTQASIDFTAIMMQKK